MMVQIESRSPIRMEVDADELGSMFSDMASDAQVSVLRAVVSSMSKHQTQWDYIAIELELPENAELLRQLRSIISGMELAK